MIHKVIMYLTRTITIVLGMYLIVLLIQGIPLVVWWIGIIRITSLCHDKATATLVSGVWTLIAILLTHQWVINMDLLVTRTYRRVDDGEVD